MFAVVQCHSTGTDGCDYCLSVHTYVATKVAGLDPDEAGRARRGQASDAKAQAVLTFAKAVVDSRGGVDDVDLKAAQQAGLSAGEIAEVVGNVALRAWRWWSGPMKNK